MFTDKYIQAPNKQGTMKCPSGKKQLLDFLLKKSYIYLQLLKKKNSEQ